MELDPFFFKMMIRKRGVVKTLMTLGAAGAVYQLMPIGKLALIGVTCVAFCVGHVLTKYLFNLLPRAYISDCSDKAVLITGKCQLRNSTSDQSRVWSLWTLLRS